MMRRLICLGLVALLISGCGWRLRGTLDLPEGLEQVFLDNDSESEPLGRQIEDLLIANGVDLADSPQGAQLILQLLEYDEERRVVSVGDNTLVTEYELIAEADFSISDDAGNLLLPPSDVTLVRAYQFDQDNVLGKAQEEELIREEMQREIAQQIVRRLRFLPEQEAAALQAR